MVNVIDVKQDNCWHSRVYICCSAFLISVLFVFEFYNIIFYRTRKEHPSSLNYILMLKRQKEQKHLVYKFDPRFVSCSLHIEIL